ncbi:hypothetical protein JNK62_01415 [bacterium]|nr:hypothetical protein [bacterium]
MRQPDIALAAYLLDFMRGTWLDYSWSREARRFLPSLLLGVYVWHRRGKYPTMRDAAAFMHADPASSGPKYIRQAADAGLIRVENHPRDKRKYILFPTEKLMHLMDKELTKIGTVAQ